MKSNHQQSAASDDENFKAFIQKYYAQDAKSSHLGLNGFSFKGLTITDLNSWRDFLYKQEKVFQLNHYHELQNEQ